ncbi:hypothetical protein MOPEL_113_00010 [Mobilicoccus pelagius NBRC 104925]|uniref:Uncharacterized protein n=1 Tax=Mobilicoccus pelagius NBRC 104925 TaxID=1089455 RepID=H5UUB3_9MICO|nr:hypothetical protein MOPEL_113_00010 [Mobilicoccus pelagius NBRC 104925]
MTPEQRTAQRRLVGLLHGPARLTPDGAQVRIWRDPRDCGDFMMSVEEVTEVLDVLDVEYHVVAPAPRPPHFGRNRSLHGVEVRVDSTQLTRWSPAPRRALAQLTPQPTA